MFQWLNSWRQNRQQRRQAAAEARRLEGRAIFHYHDGQRDRYADPMAVWQAILNGPVDIIQQVPACMALQEPEATDVPRRLREIFAVDSWDPQTKTGLTGWEVLGLYHQFSLYIAELKKNGSPGQISGAPSDPAPSTGNSPPSDPTNASSDSTSTPAESTPAVATTS